jgi:hypothetical protein
MTQKPIDIKGRMVRRSIEPHPDLKPEAVEHRRNALSADATKRARTKFTTAVIFSE